jgi:hypothetical protein
VYIVVLEVQTDFLEEIASLLVSFKEFRVTRAHILNPEDLGSIFFRNVGIHLQHCTLSQVRRERYEQKTVLFFFDPALIRGYFMWHLWWIK